MKRSGDELNFSEGERSNKSRKTWNFARADRDGTEGNASSSSSIGDVGGPETAKEKLKRKLLQRKDDGAEILESWLLAHATDTRACYIFGHRFHCEAFSTVFSTVFHCPH